MQIALTLVSQNFIMFLLAGIGFLLFKAKKISPDGSKGIGNILIYVVLPGVIINGFMVERTKEHLVALLLSALLACIILVISILMSKLFFRNDPIAAFAAAFSNPGFFGVPLIIASLTEGAVFYIAAFIGFLNLMQWTYGISLMTGRQGKIKIGALVKAPFFISIIVGLLLFLTQCPLPVQVTNTLSYLAGLNAPLAMFLVGIYMAQTDLVGMFKKKQIYLACLVRLVLIPLLSVLVLLPVPMQFMEMKLAILIASACPVGSNIAIYAQLHEQDYPYAVEIVVVSTLFSIITIPVIIWIAM
ncbi:hypothetical protein DWX43_21660 [Clostridium sp. AF19-22AC]|uniref:AEC family transporter n=1 Tax=Clostridia TaxID=186801 RepID=UPI000E555A52|nr:MULTISPECIES: AEC family transporter [Clostridia]RHR22573.1 hypothetical protein DWX43_21660 [Clostridium sp. AF19-22AC]